MNKKAEAGETLKSDVIYILLTILFLIPMFMFISIYSNHAVFWGDFYSKEIASTINLAKPGDNITLDLHKGISIALKNKIPKDQIFYFNNLKKEICVKLNLNRRTCYSYYNNVDIINVEIKLADPTNKLMFYVKESAK